MPTMTLWGVLHLRRQLHEGLSEFNGTDADYVVMTRRLRYEASGWCSRYTGQFACLREFEGVPILVAHDENGCRIVAESLRESGKRVIVLTTPPPEPTPRDVAQYHDLVKQLLTLEFRFTADEAARAVNHEVDLMTSAIMANLPLRACAMRVESAWRASAEKTTQ